MTSKENTNKLSVEGARNKFLATVQGIVNNDRNKDYGSAEDSFNTIAAFWTVWLNAQGHSVILDAYDVAAMMDLMKSARLVKNKTHMDSWVDKAGYSACAGGILEQTLEACEKRNEQDFSKYFGEPELKASTNPEKDFDIDTLAKSIVDIVMNTVPDTSKYFAYYTTKDGGEWQELPYLIYVEDKNIAEWADKKGYFALRTTAFRVWDRVNGWRTKE